MRWLVETFGGLWELLLLAAKSKFRLRSAYWRWRNETAFGTNPGKQPSASERRKAILEYGRWVFRMKRL